MPHCARPKNRLLPYHSEPPSLRPFSPLHAYFDAADPFHVGQNLFKPPKPRTWIKKRDKKEISLLGCPPQRPTATLLKVCAPSQEALLYSTPRKLCRSRPKKRSLSGRFSGTEKRLRRYPQNVTRRRRRPAVLVRSARLPGSLSAVKR